MFSSYKKIRIRLREWMHYLKKRAALRKIGHFTEYAVLAALLWRGLHGTFNTAGKTVFVADAHRCDGKRFIVRADELLTAFVELERAAGEDEDLGPLWDSLQAAID
jgi:hypothetical protein